MAKRLLLILAGVLFFLLFVTFLANTYYTFSRLATEGDPGWGVDNDTGRLRMQTFDASNPAFSVLREGDEIIALNGQSYTRNGAQYYKAFHHAPPGALYTVAVRRSSGGQIREFTLHTTTTARWQWELVFLFTLISAVFLLTGIAIFLLRPGDKQALLLALILTGFGGLPNRDIFAVSWLLAVVLVIANNIAQLPLFFLHFFLIFPQRSPLLRRFPRFEWWPYLTFLLFAFPFAAVSSYLYVTTPIEGYYPEKSFPLLYRLSNVFYLLCVVGGLVSLIVNYLKADRTSKRKLRVVLVGTFVGVVPPVSANIAFTYYNPSFTPSVLLIVAAANALLLLVPLSFAYAILRHKVIPVSLIIRRSVRYLLVSRGSIALEIIVVAVALAFLLHNFFKYLNTSSGLVIGVVSAVFAIIVWNVTAAFNHRVIKPVIDRRFFRQSYDAHAVLSDLSRAVRTVTSTQQLLELVIIEVQQALHTANVTIFMSDESSDDFTCALSSEYQEDIHASIASRPPLVLPHDGLVLKQLRGAAEPLHVDFTDPNAWMHEASAASKEMQTRGRETLQAIHSALLLPLETKDRMLGVVSLGPRLGDLPFSKEDERLLMSVAAQTSVALDNARLVESMITEERKRHLIEAENNRRAHELEEARGLQLSMLPKTVPQLPNLEIAAYMKPATEVGGDYYDFHVGDDGTLTVAVGDATGHGLKAGTMVTAAKSLFETLAHTPDIPQIFNQSSRVLKRMNLRSLYMAMMIMKIKDNRLTVSVAGMPPVLLYRAATGCVEQLALTGMPLGSVKEFPYKQQELPLCVGDTLVLMSDGFPEMFNEAGEMIDYQRAKTLLEEIAQHNSPQEIINHFVRTGDEWAGARPQDDDVTFVVLKVKDGNAAGNGTHAAL